MIYQVTTVDQRGNTALVTHDVTTVSVVSDGTLVMGDVKSPQATYKKDRWKQVEAKP